MAQTQHDPALAAGTLTTELFLQQVRKARPETAVFDYDGTLWPGDAGSGFMDWSIRTGLLGPERAAWLQQRHGSYHRREVGETAICGEMVQIYRGLPESALREGARAYFQAEVEPHLFTAMAALVRELQRSGAEIWIVSSTNNWVIEEGVRAFGIAPERVLAACVHTDSAVLTNRLIDVPSGEGKAQALRRVGLRQPHVVFGNSIHDAAMLHLARHPFAVNPNASLRTYAEKRGWPMYYPASQTWPVAKRSCAQLPASNLLKE